MLACHITLFQYLGISYFLTRRYTDAATTWVGVISILEKNTSKDKMVSPPFSFLLPSPLLSLSSPLPALRSPVPTLLAVHHDDTLDALS